MLEVSRDYFGISPSRMHREIQAMRNHLDEILARKNIRYDELKSALVPNQARREVALVFDSSTTGEYSYGLAVFKRLIPLLQRDSKLSILDGDYIGENDQQRSLFDAMAEAVRFNKEVTFRHSSQFYIVYLNNLTLPMIESIDSGLADWPPYVGYADTTYGSRFKLMLSTMLANVCVKAGRVIIQGHEDDRPHDEDVNMSGFPFEESGYQCRSVPLYLHGVLLNYKIERPVFPGFQVDTEFALNAISETPLPLEGFTVQVDEAKLNYIKKEKAGSLARARLEGITSGELAELIQKKITASYIYSMAPDPTGRIVKFNVIIEVGTADSEPTRLLAALEYQPDNAVLRLLTLF